MPKAHCKSCKKELEKDNRIKHKNAYYCEECYSAVKEKEEQQALTKANTESQQYKDLIAYICTTFNLTAPTGMVLKQIQNNKKLGFTYAGQAYTLWYCKEILNNFNREKLLTYGVYVIKQYYEEAENYYNKQEEQAEKIKEVNYSDIKSKVVKINKPIIKSNQNSNCSVGLLNLDSMLGCDNK